MNNYKEFANSVKFHQLLNILKNIHFHFLKFFGGYFKANEDHLRVSSPLRNGFLRLPHFTFTFHKFDQVAKSQGQGQTSTAAKAEKTITIMSAVMVSCFLIAWTPYAIMAMGATYGSPEVFTPSIAVLPALFAKTSTCYNPVIYVFMNKQVGGPSGA